MFNNEIVVRWLFQKGFVHLLKRLCVARCTFLDLSQEFISSWYKVQSLMYILSISVDVFAVPFLCFELIAPVLLVMFHYLETLLVMG